MMKRRLIALSVLLAAALAIATGIYLGKLRSTEDFLNELRAPTGPVGFCVHLGAGDGALTVELAAGDRLAVHALESDAEKAGRARKRLESLDLYGRAAVEPWTARWLPYADNLVNVLAAENAAGVSESEMMRVVAPLGTLWVKRFFGWQPKRKPWPRGFDEWTHWRHGADGNMVSRDTAVETPTGPRWIAGPAQDPGGQKWYYDHVLVSSAGRNFYVYEKEIVARDAFNGRLLWTRAAKAGTFKETGASGALNLKPGNRTSKVRPVASGQRLFAVVDEQLVVLDAASGRTVQSFGELDTPREIAVVDSMLLVSDKNGVRALAMDGKLRWQWAGAARRMVAGDGKVFCHAGSEVVCLALADGKERWRAEHPRAAAATTCSFGCGVLALECSSWQDDGDGSGIVVFAGDTGKVLWTRNYTPGMTHYKEARTFFTDGLLWVQEETSKKPRVVKFLGLDPQTGAQRREVGTRGLHCASPVATDRFFIAPEMEFTELKTGQQSRGRMTRGSCRLPYIPANGLLNTFPLQCECFPMLRGYMGLAQTPAARDAGTPRLQPGPAAGRAMAGAAPDKADDWPIYRHDSYRSGSTPGSVGDGELKLLWSVRVAQPPQGLLAGDWAENPFARDVVTAPVCADGALVLALPDRHRVAAFDAKTGAARWSFTAGGRVDTPPTLAGNRCVFGAHDGYVYCVDLADGRLAWRFRAAPQEARIAVYGQMESPWPVAGSVLIEDGVAYAAAGRHPASDGGVRVCALRVGDGGLLWEKSVTDMGVTNWYSGLLPNSKRKVGLDFEPVDLLARDGDRIAMSRWRFEPGSGEMALALSSTNFNAFGSVEVPRGVWGYGIRQTKLVLDKPAAAFSAQQVALGGTNDVAMVLAGSTPITATASELKVGEQTLPLDASPVRNGLIVAGGRLYAVTRDGRLCCFGRD